MSNDRGRPTVRVGKVPFAATTPESAATSVIEWATNRTPVSIRLANAYCVAVASADSSYEEVMNSQGVNFPDGRPVVWAMNLLSRGGSTADHVRGPSLFRNVLGRGREVGLKHFFLGATPDALRRLTENAVRDYPGLVVAGSYAPPFGPVDAEFIEDAAVRIRASGADMVWVALGTPKQDFCTSQLAAHVERPCAGVGAAFDFVAGTVKEAPLGFQKLGIEWLYRLFAEPRRLWRRYFFGNLAFIRTTVFDSRG